ncbi:hypothetical protein [Kitasatospora aureofaciens]|uniref:hypothetical protein n=1 Tax=Kitasatospora aureofaciens TaxID=1894 RepID=UPI0038091B85
MGIFRSSLNERPRWLADELALIRTEFGQEQRSAQAELRTLHAELRQQFGTGLDSGLQDLRSELRELRRELNDAHKSITEAHREVESLRLELEAARRRPAEARTQTVDMAGAQLGASAFTADPHRNATNAHPPTVRHEEPTPDGHESAGPEPSPGEQRTLGALLERAAGVGAADVACHRDTWAFIVEQAAQNSHFRVPGIAARGGDDDQTNVTVSGRTLIAVLSALHTTARSRTASREDRALASTYYNRVASGIGEATPSQVNTTRVRIVIDDRPPQTDDSGSA